jgi:hypothetical protein
MNLQMIIYFTLLSSILLYSIYRYKHLSTSNFFILAIVLYTLLNEYTIHFLSDSLSLNYILYNVYAAVAAILSLLAIRAELNVVRHIRWLHAFIIISAALCAYSMFRYDITRTFPFATIAFVFPIIILSSFFLYWQLLNSEIETPILKRSTFWLASGLLIYHTLTFATMGVYTFFMNLSISHSSGTLMFYICMVYYGMLGYSIYLHGERPRTRRA